MGFLQRVVKNDAMKTDPQEIYNWRVLLLACSVRDPLVPSDITRSVD